MCTVFKRKSGKVFQPHEHCENGNKKSFVAKKLKCYTCYSMFGISLGEFNKSYVKDCMSKWYNDKDQRLGQRKRKAYKKRESVTKKRKAFEIRQLSSSDEITTGDENTSDDELNYSCLFLCFLIWFSFLCLL